MDILERSLVTAWIKNPVYSAPVEWTRSTTQKQTNSVTLSAEQRFFKEVKEWQLNFTEIVELFQSDTNIPRTAHVHGFILSKASTTEEKEELLYLFPEQAFTQVKKARTRKSRPSRKRWVNHIAHEPVRDKLQAWDADELITRVVWDCTIILTSDGNIPEKVTREVIASKTSHTPAMRANQKSQPVYWKKPDDISDDLWRRLKQWDFKWRLHWDRKPSKKLSWGRWFWKK